MYPVGTRVMLNPGSIYDEQNIYEGNKYHGIIVANGKEGSGRHKPCTEWEYKVEWQFPEHKALFYYDSRHLSVEAKNNQEALQLLNSEEAW